MAKLTFTFTPIPTYFRDHGWFKNHNMVIYVNWAFSRCSSTSRKEYFLQKEVELGPFEYISGRDACSEEIGLSPQNIRTVQNRLTEGGLLKKLTSKSTNKFTVYRWMTEAFSILLNQQNNQQPTSNQPAANHNLDTKIIIFEEQQQQKEKEVVGVFSDLKKMGLTEDDLNCMKKYSEERIQKAIEYSKVVPVKTTLIQMLIWHCEKKNAPEVNNSLNDQQKLAWTFNEEFPELKNYEANKKTIGKNHMQLWQNGKYHYHSLNHPVDVLRNDFEESRRDIMLAKKAREA